uniref:Uncharacterized protein n=1 Tax=Arundo donax TaxID=35708 RepID=A0A0A9BZU1_ARUDO
MVRVTSVTSTFFLFIGMVWFFFFLFPFIKWLHSTIWFTRAGSY